MRFPPRKSTRPTLHLTALIDIVFLLLIFFLLASNFVEQQGVGIQVPEAASRDNELLPDIVIDIDREGRVFFNGLTVDDHGLYEMLVRRLGGTAAGKVAIEADRQVQYETVMRVIDVAKLAGTQNFLLVTRPAAAGARDVLQPNAAGNIKGN